MDYRFHHFAKSVIKEEQQIRVVKVCGTVGMHTMVETPSRYHGRVCIR